MQEGPQHGLPVTKASSGHATTIGTWEGCRVNRLVSSFQLDTGCEAWKSELSNRRPLLPRAAGEDVSPVASIRPSPEYRAHVCRSNRRRHTARGLPRTTTASLRAPRTPGPALPGGVGVTENYLPSTQTRQFKRDEKRVQAGNSGVTQGGFWRRSCYRTGPFDVACTSPWDRSWMTYLFLLVHNFNREKSTS